MPSTPGSSTTRIRLRPDVAEALAWGKPVVALESTLIAHGLPRPENLALGRELEAIVREEGGVPATVGVIRGEPIVGLNDEELERMASGGEVPKLSVRDLGPAAARGSDGATTVASTALLASRVGVRVFATGGLGGVHRDGKDSFDESADLLTLSQHAHRRRVRRGEVDPGRAGHARAPRNLQRDGGRLSHHAAFPGFYLADSGCPIDWSVDTPGRGRGACSRRSRPTPPSSSATR